MNISGMKTGSVLLTFFILHLSPLIKLPRNGGAEMIAIRKSYRIGRWDWGVGQLNPHPGCVFFLGCGGDEKFLHPAQIPNGPRSEAERTPNGSRTEPEWIPNRSRTEPERTPNESRTDPERTPNDPKIEMYDSRKMY